ncbi:toxin YoeB [Shewanella sairae]|uniref:Putative mRNA interferase YoeB n=1 Tax=Shewanella sairae TaxID=190310 RepID=A0ABQ4PQ43_9GAMM|nr:Txe/YoeB family addiction module toxin [Shewanella sairae]MCL1132091.1 Txe/YoeB family addiction module toxin [Shewanella sairae]GIU51144.1 toxin YoeB [Shewanella sairae]
MNILFSDHAWADYLYWQQQDKKTLKRINKLIQDCTRTPFEGIGKPERLKENLSGYWSRRITDEHRLVYKATQDTLTIVALRFHYI